LIPLEAILAAGRYYLEKQGLSTGVPEKMIVATAIQSLGLDELTPFDPNEKIIEYRIAGQKARLVGMTCREFADELSTDSPAPGGGSVAALCGALAAALAAMVGNLTSDKRGFESVKEDMIKVADQCQTLKDEFLADVDRDTDAFNELMACMSLPGKTPEEKHIKSEAIKKATIHAAEIPLNVLKRTLPVIRAAIDVADKGNPNSVSDAGVALLAAKTACDGAYLNVVINLKDIEDPSAESMMSDAADIRTTVHSEVERGLGIVFEKLGINK
jgi:glutamate formiminotransferase/formiminotetrahydrofolate cyclodeaminase